MHNHIIRLSILVCVSGFGRAAEPPELTPPIIYQEDRDIPRRLKDHRKLLLLPGGRYVGVIYDHLNTFIPNSSPRATVPSGGTWSYRKVGGDSAELVLDGNVRVLAFTTSNTGTVGFSQDSFSLSAYPTKIPISNCSNRGLVAVGGSLQTGFVVADRESRLLIRAVGPSLGALGVGGPLQRPVLSVTRADNRTVTVTNQRWEESEDDIAGLSERVGAFPLEKASFDAALVLRPSTGAYLIEVTSGVAGLSGEVLIEIYAL